MFASSHDGEELSRTERLTLQVCRAINERSLPKAWQRWFQRNIGRTWIDLCTRNRVQVRGLEPLLALEPPAGVMLCANHRSFFDLYVVSMLLVKHRVPWMRDLYFPVRSNFFYDSLSGLAVNLSMGGGAMYPPIFRSRGKSAMNQHSLDRVIELLGQPGVVVGMHPEGTRNKGDDPYQLLPAQPGVGRVAVRSQATVVPVWISGLGNDLVAAVTTNFRREAAAEAPVYVLFGEPVDLDDLRGQRQRPAVDMRAARRIHDRIRALSEQERSWRAERDGGADRAP